MVMTVFGTVGDNGGVRSCPKNGGKTEWKVDKAGKIVDKRWNI